MIAALLEKYWEAETTVEEEAKLSAYFRGSEVPAEWASYREVFGYFAEEAELTVSADFDKRMLERIAAEDAGLGPVTGGAAPAPAVLRHAPWWAAAAVILLSVGGALMFKGDVHVKAPTAMIEDTYDDPAEALAAVKMALAKVGRHMNEGKNIANKQLRQFNKINYAINN